MPSLACFEVALPIIAGQVGVDDGALLPLGEPLVGEVGGAPTPLGFWTLVRV